MRLTEHGFKLGVVGIERYSLFEEKVKKIKTEKERLESIKININSSDNVYLKDNYDLEMKETRSLASLLKTPKIQYSDLMHLSAFGLTANASVGHLVATDIKYEGYAAKQEKDIQNLKSSYKITIPENLDYTNVQGLSNEAIERLNRAKPDSIGQASNVPGINSSSLALIKIHLKKNQFI